MRRLNPKLLLISASLSGLASPTLYSQDTLPNDAVVYADFESADYGNWRVEGNAFGNAPAQGTLPGQMTVDGFTGKQLVNSFVGGDPSTGKLTSPEFTITKKWIRFQVGGGKDRERLLFKLIVDGKVVRSSTGLNERAGGSERLVWNQWDLTELIGKKAHLEIEDRATGGWGHINLDQIVFTDEKLDLPDLELQRELTPNSSVLWVPIKNGAPVQRVRIDVAGKIWREFDVELTSQEPDWYAPIDLTEVSGQKLLIILDGLVSDRNLLSGIVAAKSVAATKMRNDRPILHFAPPYGWNNDPNGMVYANGEWHLFYQFNPYGRKWGNMHWGHAVSSDLVTWRDLPIALYPKAYGDWAFSGSAIVDWNSTSGLGSRENPPLILAYTSTGRGECIAYSLDRGRSWKEIEENPVVKHQGRDPKIIWHPEAEHWVMAVYDEDQGKQQIAFYSSSDLRKWNRESVIDGFFECPDLFPLKVVGTNETKWVLSAANSDYMIGQFDGRKFVPETEKLRGNYGNCFYAAQTFSDVPDNRRVIIGWMRSESPTHLFSQCMSLPSELTLKQTKEGTRLHWAPAQEVSERLGKTREIVNQPNSRESEFETATAAFVRLSFKSNDRGIYTWRIGDNQINIDLEKNQLSIGDQKVELLSGKEGVSVLAVTDLTTLELYANDGAVYIPWASNFVAGKVTHKLETQSGALGAVNISIAEPRK